MTIRQKDNKTERQKQQRHRNIEKEKVRKTTERQ